MSGSFGPAITLAPGQCSTDVCIYVHDGGFRQAEPNNVDLPAGCISSDNQRCKLCSYQTTVRL